MGSLLPNENESPKFGQIYFYDPDQQVNFRGEIFNDLSPNLLKQIQTLLHEINPFVHQFQHASKFIDQNPAINLKLKILQDNNVDKRRYNKPTANEVAAIISGTDQDRLNLSREIIIYKKNPPNRNVLQIISDDHDAYDPLHYVLMHPFGEHGWAYRLYRKFPNENLQQTTENDIVDHSNENNVDHNDIQLLNQDDISNISTNETDFEYEDDNDLNDISASSRQSRFVSCCEFYKSKLMRYEDSHFHYFSRLYQQYIVDSYLKVEHQKLKYLELNQEKLRVELYKGLVDAFNSADSDLEHTGRMLILPSTFVGGPRYMLNLFQDSMAIVREFGKPDLFITITCKPKWPEIVSELKPGQTPQDIPDIVSRIFRLKLKAIMEMIMEKLILGRVIAHMYVIEFQKSGTFFKIINSQPNISIN